MDILLAEMLSLVAGFITGFVFERRATNRAREYNDDLQRQVSVLKTRVFSLSGKPPESPDAARVEDLAGLITERAIATQNPAGRVDRRALTAHFVEREYTPADVSAVISSLCQTGVAEEDGIWLQMA
jgi:hypothetical protein